MTGSAWGVYGPRWTLNGFNLLIMGRGSGGREWLADRTGPEAGGFTKKLFFLQFFKVFGRFGGN